MQFSFKSVIDLINISVAEVIIYDDRSNPLSVEYVEISRVDIHGEQFGIFDVDDSTAILPKESQTN